MGAIDEAAFSELVNHPVDTVARLRETRRRALLLRRRGDEDLVLTLAARAEQDAEVVSTAARLLAAVLRNPVTRSQLGLDLMREVFPWVRFLPADDLGEFVAELTEVFEASADLDNPAPVVQAIAEWRATAEVHADPDLAAVLLRGTTGDFGPIPAPRTVA
ncbi:hypothetical protein ABN034_22130 [Actinopolymorpha sp. B11F2]|uniref:hypothetical protein n=1 Tax=Actinopolymorpha sp. B11F2 TaxID=3160862 RepID=UPI0032E509F1